jgi:hypothetical protein
MVFTYSSIAISLGLLGVSLIFAFIGLFIERGKQPGKEINPTPIIFKLLFIFLSVTTIYTLENIVSKLALSSGEIEIQNLIDSNIIVPTQVIMFALFVYLVVIFILYIVAIVKTSVEEGKRVAVRSEGRTNR